nr:MAG TPA: hypothetical protein [Caudoviricetes sp.]
MKIVFCIYYLCPYKNLAFFTFDYIIILKVEKINKKV